MRGVDIRHAAAEAEPAVEDEDEWTFGFQGTEVENDAVGFREAALLWVKKFFGRNAAGVFVLEKSGDITTGQSLRFQKRVFRLDGGEAAGWEWASRIPTARNQPPRFA